VRNFHVALDHDSHPPSRLHTKSPVPAFRRDLPRETRQRAYRCGLLVNSSSIIRENALSG
jgi:hypothetical protein